MNHYELETLINQQLDSHSFSDYAPNGLQVEGRSEIKTIITGVTACQALLDEAVGASGRCDYCPSWLFLEK
ncbi:metal-binding protein [Pantoea agglomerans]|uniref:Metal-binding protein n=1 Tax=Enterobacter agglomerans TaxID=549 RepID=A0A379AJ54_ENTAG|nr:metal-binding protein [Pantoea agglomerans]